MSKSRKKKRAKLTWHSCKANHGRKPCLGIKVKVKTMI